MLVFKFVGYIILIYLFRTRKMGSNRVHQLSGGLYVSGAPEQYKEKPPTMTSTAVPYTGGDIKKSGELGKMFDINVDSSKTSYTWQCSREVFLAIT